LLTIPEPADVGTGDGVTADDDPLIAVNRFIVRLAAEARRASQGVRAQSELDRIHRSLGRRRPAEWGFEMARWVAGMRPHPPSARHLSAARNPASD
jgi:hypothetical protein